DGKPQFAEGALSKGAPFRGFDTPLESLVESWPSCGATGVAIQYFAFPAAFRSSERTEQHILRTLEKALGFHIRAVRVIAGEFGDRGGNFRCERPRARPRRGIVVGWPPSHA